MWTKVISSAEAFGVTLRSMNPSPTSVRKQEVLACLIVGVGLVWAAQVCTSNYYWLFRALEFTAGPTDVCALGILIWLTAKWRRVRNHTTAPLLTRREIYRAELAMLPDREATLQPW
jgi:hypothetical protein